MKCGIVILGGDAWTPVEVAQEIEAAGWDGVFVADIVYWTDPWVSLGLSLCGLSAYASARCSRLCHPRRGLAV